MSELILFPFSFVGDKGHSLDELLVPLIQLAYLVLHVFHVSVLEVIVRTTLEVTSDGAAHKFVKSLNLESFAVDKELLESFDVVLDLLDSVQFKGCHVVLKLVLGGGEHNRRHHLQVVVRPTVVYYDAQEVGVDVKL